MIAKKTGRLFSLACEIGGLLGHGTEQQVLGLAEYGACLGRAFQIQDDVLDLVSEKATLGKDIGSDIRENKKTFLMAYLFQYGAQEQQQQIRRLAEKNELSREELQQAVDVFTAAGALSAAETEIKRCITLAQTALQPIENEEAKGVFNVCAPGPVTNAEFGRALGKAMGRPSFLPLPAFAFKLAFGEASTVLLEGQRVIPARLQEMGFTFNFPTVESALEDLVG